MSERLHCSGEGCPWRNECLRFRQPRGGRYVSFSTVPWDAEELACDSFVPLPTVSEDSIRLRAHRLWVDAGRPEGRADDHWLRAEGQLAAEYEERLRPPDSDAPKR